MLKSSESIMVDYVVRASRAIFRFLHPPTTTTTTLLSILKFSPGQLFLKEASQEQRIIIARLVYGRQCQANNNCSFDIDYRPLPFLSVIANSQYEVLSSFDSSLDPSDTLRRQQQY